MYRWKRKTRVAPKARTKEEKCATARCRNRRAVNNTGYQLALCWKCRSRILKERHPWTYALNVIRGSARRRKLPFTLTVASFKKWCEDTGYLAAKGNKPESMTVDRIDWNDGYHIWNIRPMSHAENSEQGADHTPREERKEVAEAPNDDDPY